MLVIAAAVKAADAWVLRDWLFFAAGGGAAEAYWARAAFSLGACLAAAVMIVGEMAVGLVAIIDPGPTRRVLATLWGLFLGVHLAGVLVPGLGMCPCLGRHVLAESPVMAHLVWCGLSGVFLWASLMLGRPAKTRGAAQGAAA